MQPQPKFVNEFCQNIEIGTLDPDQTIEIPVEVPMYAMTAAQVQQAGLSGLETTLNDFQGEKPSDEQVVEARQCARAATDLPILMNSTEQGNLLKTQLSPVAYPENDNQMLKSLRVLQFTEQAQSASIDMLFTRIIGFTRELDQDLKNMTVQRIIDLIRSRPEIMPPE
ncbi:MAG: hypothetical protein EZS28_008633 [Streblomastix strix]|uniref:Uncharacterized protein n=1 Tax=Streblomastix strix TaxID=222440 RepID=A0A5J4WLY0_9EUKA|nr:MAG: hypothetical protein EZS28_008633 [Streblomastix strix]